MMWADAVGKMAPLDLLNKELPETFQFVKEREKKKKRNIYLQSAIKQNVIKRVMPVTEWKPFWKLKQNIYACQGFRR